MIESFNIASSLVNQARGQPEGLALIEPRGTRRPPPWQERRLTFRELDAESDRLARGLQRSGLTRGMRVVLMVPPSVEFYALTFALFKLGAVVVLVDPGMGIRNLGQCLQEADPAAFIGVPRAHLGRLLLGWARKSLRHWVTVGRRWLWGGVTLEQVRAAGAAGEPVLASTPADEMAAILFTSGSTGVAKGAIYTHAIFGAQIDMLRAMYTIKPGEVDLATFPLFGLFGPALGMTGVIPEMDATRPARVDPRCILNTIQHYRVSNLFGSPALLRRVASSPQARQSNLASLRRAISAGAPVSARVIRTLVELLPAGCEVHTPYGATEALPVSSIASKEILGETAAATAEGKGVCVGQPVPGMRVWIIRISDEPIAEWTDDIELPRGQIGEIVVGGPVVTRAYWGRPGATALHKIHASGEIRHRMGDVGYLDQQGRIWFCGRKAHRVVTREHGTLFTIPVEGVFNVHPQVFRTALVGVPRKGGDIEPVLCVEIDPDIPESKRPDYQALIKPLKQFRGELAALGARHAHTQCIRRFLIYRDFPVDVRHNAKIFREKLAVLAAREHPRGGLA